MNKPWQVISLLEAESSRLAKEEILAKEVAAKNDELFKGISLALNPLVTFGVKKVDEKRDPNPKDPKPTGLTAEAFGLLCQRLMKRELTGNEALFAINHARMKCDKDQWNNWYRRILIKDLRCGTSEKTVNKVASQVPAYQVPIFSAQLAHDSANHESKMVGSKLVEVKLDGVRVITIVYPSGHVVQYSRNGKELVNFEHIKKQISKHAIFFAEPVVLDGEVMSSSFQDLMKQIHRKSNADAGDAVLYLFDILTLSEFLAGKGEHRQIDRTYSLKSWYSTIADHMPNVDVVDQELIDLDTEEGQTRFKKINAQAIADGYEGLMLKDPMAVYETKRTVSWLKMKPFIEVTLKAVKVEEGTGKNIGKMGAVLFEGVDDGKFIRVSVGSGWSDKIRDEIWADPAAIVGQLGEIRADAVTKAQDSEEYSLRFPRFKTFRGFAKGEKL